MLKLRSNSEVFIDFNENIQIRTANEHDLEKIIKLENDMWTEDQRCSRENFINRLNVFEDGFLLAENTHGDLIGTFYGVIRNFSPNKTNYSWLSESGDGTGSSHTPSGNAMFGTSVTVHNNAPKGTLRALFNGWRANAKKHGLAYIYGGSRIPGFINHSCSPQEYLSNVLENKYFDPVLSKYIACNMRVGNLLPQYFDDPESKNYGVEVFDRIVL